MKPWEYVNQKGRAVACAWCQKEQSIAPARGESHGICPAHCLEMLRAAEIRLIIQVPKLIQVPKHPTTQPA